MVLKYKPSPVLETKPRADFLFDAESSFPAMIWGGEQIDGIFEFIAWRGDPNRGGAG